MPIKGFTHCQVCGVRLGKQNTSGRCRGCAMREHGSRRREEGIQFRRLVQACKEAGWGVASRLREFLNDQHRLENLEMARLLTPSLTAKLPVRLNETTLDRLWRFEQYMVSLPEVAFQVVGDHVHLAFLSSPFLENQADEIKRHFEAALRRDYPTLSVSWAAPLDNPR